MCHNPFLSYILKKKKKLEFHGQKVSRKKGKKSGKDFTLTLNMAQNQQTKKKTLN